MSTTVKVGALSCATAVSGFFAWWGYSIATKVFDDYKDSTDATYLTVGGIFFVFAAGICALALMTGLPQHMSRSQLLLSVAIGVALLTSTLTYFYYGPPSKPPGPDYHRSPPLETTAPGAGPSFATPSIGTPLPQR